MAHKCEGCFYRTIWNECLKADKRYPICERTHCTFDDAKKECEKPGPCKYHLTREEADRIIDAMGAVPV